MTRADKIVLGIGMIVFGLALGVVLYLYKPVQQKLVPTAPNSPNSLRTDFMSSAGMIACPLPLFEDADAAVQAADPKWLEQTGCVQLPYGLALVVISGRAGYQLSNRGAEAWRVRIYGPQGQATAYVRGWQALVTPARLAKPATILIKSFGDFPTKAAALRHWEKISAKSRKITTLLSPQIEPFTGCDVCRGWTLEVKSQTLDAAIKFCEQTSSDCLVLDQ